MTKKAAPRRRVLLVVLHMEELAGKRVASACGSPPLGVPYVAAAAREAGHEVAVLALTEPATLRAELSAALGRSRPDAVGMFCNMANQDACLEAAACVKEACPRALVVLGGAQPTGAPEPFLTCGSVDAVVVGEGERTFLELLAALDEPAAWPRVPGLVVRGPGGRALRTPKRALIKPLDALPPPALDLYPRAFWAAELEGQKVGPLLGSRGCPFECTFCASQVIWGRGARFHSPERVLDEMRGLRERYGVEHFGFYDATFTVDRRWTLEVCRLIKERGEAAWTWSCGTRAELVDAELLESMRRAGCKSVFYGFESGSQRLLDSIKKRETLDQYRTAVRLTREAGLQVYGAFIIGFPTETPKETADTLRLAAEIMADRITVSVAMPFVGTELFEEIRKRAALKDATPRELFSLVESWAPEGRTRAELERWCGVARKISKIETNAKR